MSIRKKRRISKPPDPGASDPGPLASRRSKFFHILFRRRLACFLLLTPPSSSCVGKSYARESWIYRDRGPIKEFFRPSTDLQGCPDRISEILELPGTHWMQKTIQEFVRLAVEGVSDGWVDSFDPEVHRRLPLSSRGKHGMSGREFLRKKLERYRLDDLVGFLELFGYAEGSLGVPVSEMRDFGKNHVVVSLTEFFIAGTLPQARRKEESRALEEVDLRGLRFRFCHMNLPQELVVEILSFLRSDYNLILSVGLLRWDFYALVLSTWNSAVYFHRGNVFTVPEIITRTLSSARFSSSSPYSRRSSLSTKDLQRVFGFLPRLSLRELVLDVELSKESSHCEARYLTLLWASVQKSGIFLNLRKFVLRRRNGFVPSTDLMSLRLSDVAPNVVSLRWPFSARLFEGLEQVRSLGMHLSVMKGRKVTCSRLDRVCFGLANEEQFACLETLNWLQLRCVTLVLCLSDSHRLLRKIYKSVNGTCLQRFCLEYEVCEFGTSTNSSLFDSDLADVPRLARLQKAEFRGWDCLLAYPLSFASQMDLIRKNIEHLNEITVSLPDSVVSLGTVLMESDLAVLFERIPVLRRLHLRTLDSSLLIEGKGRYITINLPLSSIYSASLSWKIDQVELHCAAWSWLRLKGPFVFDWARELTTRRLGVEGEKEETRSGDDCSYIWRSTS